MLYVKVISKDNVEVNLGYYQSYSDVAELFKSNSVLTYLTMRDNGLTSAAEISPEMLDETEGYYTNSDDTDNDIYAELVANGIIRMDCIVDDDDFVICPTIPANWEIYDVFEFIEICGHAEDDNVDVYNALISEYDDAEELYRYLPYVDEMNFIKGNAYDLAVEYIDSIG